MGLSYRFLHSDRYFKGTEEWAEVMEAEGETRMSGHTFNLFGRYSITHRWSLVLNVPLINIEESFIMMTEIDILSLQMGYVWEIFVYRPTTGSSIL